MKNTIEKLTNKKLWVKIFKCEINYYMFLKTL